MMQERTCKKRKRKKVLFNFTKKTRKIHHTDTQYTHKQITRQRLELGLDYMSHISLFVITFVFK